MPSLKATAAAEALQGRPSNGAEQCEPNEAQCNADIGMQVLNKSSLIPPMAAVVNDVGALDAAAFDAASGGDDHLRRRRQATVVVTYLLGNTSPRTIFCQNSHFA